MPRYIDAEKLLDLIRDNDEPPRYGYVDLWDIVDAPTEDVQPVKHGRWKPTWTENEVYCSECNGFVAYNPLFATDNYCRFCGAKMDKE